VPNPSTYFYNHFGSKAMAYTLGVSAYGTVEHIASGKLSREVCTRLEPTLRCHPLAPSFNHYHVCKHSLALGIFKDKVKVPVRFNCEPCGKRKAPAGASLRKRARALEIDK